MNPDDAAARDLADGAIVRIYNECGACLAGLRIEKDIMRGVVAMATGATMEIIETAQGPLEIHGNPNVLTQDTGTSGLGQGSFALTCLVEVEGWTGPVPDVTVFDPLHFVPRA